MESLDVVRTFFGWALVLNLLFYTITAFALMAFKARVSGLCARFFGVEEQAALNASFAYLAHYKLLVIVFFLAPYFALKLMA